MRARRWLRCVQCTTLEPGGVTIFNSIAMNHPARTGADRVCQDLRDCTRVTTEYGITVSCTGNADGAGAPCALNGDKSGCAAASGDCLYQTFHLDDRSRSVPAIATRYARMRLVAADTNWQIVEVSVRRSAIIGGDVNIMKVPITVTVDHVLQTTAGQITDGTNSAWTGTAVAGQTIEVVLDLGRVGIVESIEIVQATTDSVAEILLDWADTNTVATVWQSTAADSTVALNQGTMLADRTTTLEFGGIGSTWPKLPGETMYTTDRKCAPYSICTCEEFAAEMSPVDADRICQPLTQCSDDEYESTYPTKILVCDEPHPIPYEANHEPDGTFEQRSHLELEDGSMRPTQEKHCHWLNTADRACTKFADYHGPFEVGTSAIDVPINFAPTAGVDSMCRADDALCNDGGTCGVAEYGVDCGPTVCAWGSDSDCPPRSVPANIDQSYFCSSGMYFTNANTVVVDPVAGTEREETAAEVCDLQSCCRWNTASAGSCEADPSATTCDITLRNQAHTSRDSTANRADDCLPFYLNPGGNDIRGQYWNKGTVRAELPDVIMPTAAGESYAIIDDTQVDGDYVSLLTWDFVKGAKTLTARDNFFADEYWQGGTAGGTTSSDDEYWQGGTAVTPDGVQSYIGQVSPRTPDSIRQPRPPPVRTIPHGACPWVLTVSPSLAYRT